MITATLIRHFSVSFGSWRYEIVTAAPMEVVTCRRGGTAEANADAGIQ